MLMVLLPETAVNIEKTYFANNVCICFFLFVLVFGFDVMKKNIRQLNHVRAVTLNFYCSAEEIPPMDEINYIVGENLTPDAGKTHVSQSTFILIYFIRLRHEFKT